jgi:tetratricopeptide (TPR) repeat protein
MERNGSKKAIVIGISDYDLLPPLSFCKIDGVKMYELLRSIGYEIQENHKLIGKVKREEMRDAIIDFFRNRKVKPRDTLLFYYSGHGVLDSFGDHYLAPSALNPFEPDTNGFHFDELTKMMQKSISQRIVSILDCCYSGAAKIGKGGEEDAANAGRKAIDEKSRILERSKGKCILAASQEYQKSFETVQKDNSLFTYYLLEGLSGQATNDDGNVTPDSLGNYAYEKIMSLPSEQIPMQTPIRKGEQSGDIILVSYPQLARQKTAYSESVPIEDLKSVVNKCRQYFDKGEFKLELDYLQEAINKYPNNSDLWNYKGVALAKLSRYDEAISCFDIAIMLNPKSANLRMNRGDSLSKQGRIEESIKSFDNALMLDVNNSRAWSLKARLLINQKKYEAALECLDKATQITNEKVLWNDKGFTLAGLGRYQEAIQSYENGLKIDPNYDVTLNNKGLALYRLGKYQEAINCFDRILILNPNIKHVLINKYKALDKLGKTKEAELCYERSQKIDLGNNNNELYDAHGRLIS